MAYIAPYIDEKGLHIPRYQDIVDDMVESAKVIFGDDIYLENDSADYQLISVFALKTYDMLQAIMYAYNARSPVTAIGTSLDTIVKMNGISRKAAGYSTCDVKISGTANTEIIKGEVQDTAGNKWSLPDKIIIPDAGEITVTATCQAAGPITIGIGELNKIATPTYGWREVTNEVAAVPGNAQETDDELRIRQTKSVMAPSQTLLAGTLAGILAVPNVRHAVCYENDTNDNAVTPRNPYGLPAHSIACIVEGGDNTEIATAILAHKGIGCYTHGDVEVDLPGTGEFINTIRFSRPAYITPHVNVVLTRYHDFTNSYLPIVQQAIFDYLKELKIGSDISVSMLVSVIMSCNPDIAKPNFGVKTITIGPSAEEMATADIDLRYNEIVDVAMENIEVGVQ